MQITGHKKNLFLAEYPCCFNGIETANPSGKFCKPIPIAREIAAPKVASGKPNDAAPNATPIASPSGILCIVIARTRRLLVYNFVFLPSVTTGGKFGCRCGIILSIILIVIPPNKKPMATGNHGINSCFESSNAGESRDQ